MPSLFHSETDLFLAFPDLHTVELRTKKDGEGTVQYTAKTVELAGNVHTLDIAHKAEPAAYRVTEAIVGGDKTYTVSYIGAKYAGYSSTLEVAGLMHGKHLFQGPDNEHYNWSGKGDKLELLVVSDGNKEIAEFEPEERLLQLKTERFGKHKDLDTEFVVASFFALLLFQDEYNKVKDADDVLGRAKGRTWKERAELATRPKVAAASTTLAGAAEYASSTFASVSKTLQDKAAAYQKKE